VTASTRNSSSGGSAALLESSAFAAQRLGSLAQARLESELPKVGLTVRSCLVLASVAHSDTMSQQDISRALGIDPTTMVALVDQLEEAGFVIRTRSKVDRRRYDLSATKAGNAALGAAAKLVQSVDADLFASLRPTELTAYQKAAAKALAGAG
jgi:DNA-binding MarR family transcriptional regulator